MSRPHRALPALFVAVFGVALLNYATIAADVGRPFGNYFSYFSTLPNAWVVSRLTPARWPLLAEGQLTFGDHLLALDGRPYDTLERERFAAAFEAGLRTLTVEVERAGERLAVGVPLSRLTIGHLLETVTPFLVSGVIFYLLGLIVYAAGPDNRLNQVFAAACGLVALHRWVIFGGPFDRSTTWYLIGHLALVLAAPFIAALTVHFGTLFPLPAHRLPRGSLAIVYGLAAASAAAMIAGTILSWVRPVTPFISGLDNSGYFASLVLLGLAVLFVVARLIWISLRSRSAPRPRRQSLILLAGFVLGLPVIAMMIFEGLRPELANYLWADLNLQYLLLAIPLALTYAILRYHTFRAHHPLFLVVTVLASSALLASVGSWLLRRAAAGAAVTFAIPPFYPIFALLLVASLFWSHESSWRGGLGRLFHWEKRSYTAVRQFGHHVLRSLDLRTLPTTIAEALVTELELEQAAVWLWDEGDAALVLRGRAGRWRLDPPETLTLDARQQMLATTPIYLRRADADAPDELLALQAAGIEVVAPLGVGDRLLGLIAAGKRWDDEIFDDRDLEIIDLITQQATMFTLEALQVEELRRVPRRVAEAEERERTRLAQELHDTIQQFLGRLPFFLEVSRTSIAIDPAETDLILQRCIQDVESAAQAVRQIRHNLSPTFLERGLIMPLESLLERFRQRSGLAARLEAPEEDEPRLSPEARHALFRVIQQALDNVVAHAHAREVVIGLSEDAGRVLFWIKDDGRGCTAAEVARARDAGSYGLQSMQDRVQNLGGGFTFTSQPGRGTEVAGWLPSSANEESRDIPQANRGISP